MNQQEILLEARRYADGDGVMVDAERAYHLLALISDELQGDDKALYEELKRLYSPEARESVPTVRMTLASGLQSRRVSDGYPSLIQKAARSSAGAHSADEVRELFQKAMANATPQKLDLLYRALENAEQGVSGTRVIKNENKAFGNNLGAFLCQVKVGVGVFRNRFNVKLSEHGLSTSREALYGYISGKNGISGAKLAILIELLNEYDRAKSVLKAPLTAEQMYLPLFSFSNLFKDFDWSDPKLQRLREPSSED